jgi:hypothetical protein
MLSFTDSFNFFVELAVPRAVAAEGAPRLAGTTTGSIPSSSHAITYLALLCLSSMLLMSSPWFPSARPRVEGSPGISLPASSLSS